MLGVAAGAGGASQAAQGEGGAHFPQLQRHSPFDTRHNVTLAGGDAVAPTVSERERTFEIGT